ncbi:MAG: histidine kinase, partial [Solibacillus isronensis]
MKNNKLYLQLFLIFMVATAVSLIFTNGGRYLGKTFYESQNYNNEAENLVYEFSQYVFNTPTEEEFKGALTVSDEEMDDYRTYYGSLAEQIQNIKEQYSSEINATQDQ